jgi:hypothetical protein
MLGNPAFAVAAKAIYDCFKHLKDGGAVEDLLDKQAAADLLRAVNRTDEFGSSSFLVSRSGVNGHCGIIRDYVG